MGCTYCSICGSYVAITDEEANLHWNDQYWCKICQITGLQALMKKVKVTLG